MAARDDIVSAMGHRLWTRAIESGPADVTRDSAGGAVHKAALDLARLYEHMNGATLVSMMTRFFRQDTYRNRTRFGHDLVDAALDRERGEWEWLSARIQIPYFLVMFTGKGAKRELFWEGGEADEAGKLFGRSERANTAEDELERDIGVRNPRRRASGEYTIKIGDRVKVQDEVGDWYGQVVEKGRETVTVVSEEDRPDISIWKGDRRTVNYGWVGLRPKR